MTASTMTHEQLLYAHERLQKQNKILCSKLPADARFQAACAAMQGLLGNDKCASRIADVADQMAGWTDAQKDAAFARKVAEHAALIADSLLDAMSST